ncbi:MAG: hypothetical protein HKN87_05435 [Saprospiraceae bacterium]|nr:hypothetical protein [Saprospiraceae bacterium]
MHRFLLVLTLASWCIVSYAQTITVSSELSLRSEYNYDILGVMDGNLLLIRDGINEFDVQAYDEDMYMTWEAEKELDSRKSRIINIIPHDDRFYILYSDDWKDSLAIMVRVYNPKAQLEYTDTIKTLKRGLVRPKYRFTKSEDRNIFLMTEMESERIVSAFAYNLRESELLWETELQFTNINFREEYRKTLISNDGTMFLVFEKNNLRYRKEEHALGIFRFTRGNQDVSAVEVPITEFTTYDGYFMFDNLNQKVVIIGLYSDKNSGITDGIYHVRIDANNLENYKLSTVDYNAELIADFHGKFNPKKESLTNLDVQDVVLRQDGGALVLAEENKEYERLSYGSRRDYYGSNRFSVDYYYEDLVLISIHPDGTSHWQKLLPKRQYSNDDLGAYSSYYIFTNPSYLRILYNDEIRNDNTVSEYILNGAGDITRRSLMSTDNQKIKLQIKNAVQIDSETLVIPSVRGNRLKLVKLEY